MATNYPGAIDTYTNPLSSEPMNAPSHAGQHANANDAVEAIETELGTNPSGSAATVKARLDGIEDGTRLGTNSVGATQIANDSVDTNAIQSKAVTAAKIADDTITAAQIAANAVGASELADNAVDTNAIADGAATPAKLATTGRFVFPTGAANGYGFASGAVHLSGTGTPEGVVTAAPGSTWLQTDSTTDVKGWIRWQKATGTGSTGWVAGAEADTGWRNVASLVTWPSETGDTFGIARLRRRGDTVTLVTRGALGSVTGTTQFTVMTIPDGFRGYTPEDVSGWTWFATRELNDTSHGYVMVPSSGRVKCQAKVINGSWAGGQITYQTSQAWPTSLPGTA